MTQATSAGYVFITDGFRDDFGEGVLIMKGVENHNFQMP